MPAVNLRARTSQVRSIDAISSKVQLRADSMRKTVEIRLSGEYPNSRGDAGGEVKSVVVPRDAVMLAELREAIGLALAEMATWNDDDGNR